MKKPTTAKAATKKPTAAQETAKKVARLRKAKAQYAKSETVCNNAYRIFDLALAELKAAIKAL